MSIEQYIATKADIAVLSEQMKRIEAMISGIKPEPERVSIPEAAKGCRVTVQTVRRWINSGEIKAEGSPRTIAYLAE